jgi:exodeoxyribonuclease VII small subunit
MSEPIHFENSIEELEIIVKKLEQGDLPLQDSLLQFERGITLARQCQELLQKAEQTIEILSSGPVQSEPCE